MSGYYYCLKPCNSKNFIADGLKVEGNLKGGRCYCKYVLLF